MSNPTPQAYRQLIINLIDDQLDPAEYQHLYELIRKTYAVEDKEIDMCKCGWASPLPVGTCMCCDKPIQPEQHDAECRCYSCVEFRRE